jgi:hypothetical protein
LLCADEALIGIIDEKFLHLSSVGTIKADTHVQNCVKKAIGRLPSNDEIVRSLEAVAKHLGWQAARLDSAIWDFQRSGPVT